MAVLFPVLNQVQNDLPRFKCITIKTLEIICFVVFLLRGRMYLISEELIVTLFTEKWLIDYNYHRPNETLEDLTPSNFFKGIIKVKNCQPKSGLDFWDGYSRMVNPSYTKDRLKVSEAEQ